MSKRLVVASFTVMLLLLCAVTRFEAMPGRPAGAASGGTDEVTAPTPPEGPAEGTVSTAYDYTTGGSTCASGGGVEYQFDWGDGTTSDWLTPALAFGELDAGGAVAAGSEPPFSYYYQGRLVVMEPSRELVAVEESAGTDLAARHSLVDREGWQRDQRSARDALARRGLVLYRVSSAVPAKGAAAPAAAAPTALERALALGLPAQPVFELGGATKIASDEVIVGFRGATSLDEARRFVAAQPAALGLQGVQPLFGDLFVVRIANAAGGRAYAVARALARAPELAFAEPNHVLILHRDAEENGMRLEGTAAPASARSRPLSAASAAAASPLPAADPLAAPGWTTILSDNFEVNGAVAWQVDSVGSSSWIYPEYSTAHVRSGSRSVYMTGWDDYYGTTLTPPYPDGVDSILRTPPLNLQGYEEVYVEYWFWAEYEDPSACSGQSPPLCDYGKAYIYDPSTTSLSGGYVAVPFTGQLWADPTAQNGWRRALVRVPPPFLKNGVEFRWEFLSDSSLNAGGLFIDDVRIVGTTNVDTESIGNDPYGGRQYELKNVGQIAGLGHDDNDLNAVEAWSLVTVSSGVVVAVIDDGVEPGHPDLNLVTGYDGDTGAVGGAPRDADSNHGTACAGNVGAIRNNGIGVSGTAPGVNIMPVHNGGTEATLANAIQLAVTHGATVLSNSWGWVGGENAAITTAFQNALAAGRAVVIAAGNGPDRDPWTYDTAFPCNLTAQMAVVCVGASSPTDEHKSAASSDGLTTWGSSYVGAGPDVVAPGPWSYTTDRLGAVGYNQDAAATGVDADYEFQFGGTSSSTPKVAGIVALMLSKNPALTPAQVKSILRQTADDIGTPGEDDKTGTGRVDARAAVLASGGGGGGNPAPVLIGIAPSSAAAGSQGFTLTVNGSGFVNGSVVRWNGADRPTSFVSTAQLTATIAAADVATAGTADVTVYTPAPGGGTSATQTFTITGGAGNNTVTVSHAWESNGIYPVKARARCASDTGKVSPDSGSLSVTITGGVEDNPVPVLTGIAPSSAAAGSPGFTLTANGSSFIDGSVVRWNGADRPTSFVSTTQLTATIAAADVATAGMAEVTVFTPAPGGGTSAAQAFTITGGTATTPRTPEGPAAGVPATAYEYRSGSAACSLGEAVQYQFDWGDGTVSTWLDPTTPAGTPGTPGAAAMASPVVPVETAGDPRADLERLAPLARERGRIRVIVTLREPFAPEGFMAPASALSQQDRIARAQDAVLARLAGEQVAVHRRYRFVAALALEADERALERLAASPEVARLEADRLHQPTLEQSVPLIGGPAAWAAGATGAGQAVAILDTGVERNHPFLAGKVVAEACFSTTNENEGTISACPNGQSSQVGVGAATPCSDPTCDHGTHCAGIAAGQGTTFSGVAREASIIAVQVFSVLNGGGAGSYTSDDIAGLEWVYAQRNAYAIASVNMSLGGGRFYGACDGDSPAMKQAVDNLRAAGIATVIASGNNGYTDSISHPACISSAIAVGSTTKFDTVSTDFSNSATMLKLLAPGSGIYSSVVGSGFGFKDGTSMAAPHVAGAWAALKSKKPAATVDEVLAAFTNTGLSITDPRNALARPRIRVDQAAAALIGGGGGGGGGDVVTQHDWAAAGSYPVKVRARCASTQSVESAWSSPLTVTISVPETVSAPDTLAGPATGQPGQSLTFTTGGANSSHGDAVQYLFDWLDGTDSGWLPVGTTSASHAWNTRGSWGVRTKARSAVNTAVESGWSATLPVSIRLATGPDLVASWSGAKQTCKTQRGVTTCTIKGKLIVQNNGTLNSTATQAWAFISVDNLPSDDDALLKTFAVKALKPRAKKKLKLSYKLPAGYTAAGLYLLGYVDPTDTVAETGESNNLANGGVLR